MSSRLDFIVFGVGRSGTTSVSRYISATEQFHCGIERFHVGVDHSTLRVPFAFFSDEHLPRGHANFKFSERDLFEKNVRILRYGNKLPTYFYRLKGVLGEIGVPKGILCARAIRSVGLSFNTRAASIKDGWPKGRTALFAAGDAMILIHALRSIEDEKILVMPYPAILKDWEMATRKMLEFIDPDIIPSFRKPVLEDIQKHYQGLKKKSKAELSGTDKVAIEAVEQAGFDDLLLREEAYPLDEIRDRLDAVAQALPIDPIAFVEAAAAKHELPEVREFLPVWLRRVRRSQKELGLS